MVKRILIDGAHPEEARIVIADDGRLDEFDFESASKKQLKGNIYLAKITRVEPSLQAAFVEYGGGRQGFLPFSEIHYDYFQIPTEDKEKLREMDNREQQEETGDAQPNENNQKIQALAVENDFSATAQAESVDDLRPLAESTPLTEAVAIENAFATVAPDETEHNDSDGQENHASADPQVIEHEDVEVMGEESDAPVIKRSSFYRKYKIQEVIKRNQIVLIQVVKEERGNKGASLTTYISIPGRYCVFMPNTPRQGGLSRRISSSEDRRRLREVMDSLEVDAGSSLIIRTAGVDRNKADIKRDFEYLQKLWHSVRELAISSQAPALVYEEGNLIKRFIRDMYYPSIEEIIVEGEEIYNATRETMKMFLPSHAGRVKLFAEKMPIFRKYQIEDELVKLYDNRAYLKSGGYIVINPTEALVSIDVNSGRATRERNVEETAAKTNLEAAYEIARQLRLRDLAGLVVIDFIDMMEGRNRRAVERALKDALSTDRARIQVGRISPFGLMEMSRQRLRSSFLESNTVVCPHCNGTGSMRSHDSVAVDIIRAIENEAAKGKYEEIHLACSMEVAVFVLNKKRHEINAIEANYGVRVVIRGDHTLIAHNFLLDKTRSILSKKRRERGADEPKEAVVSSPIKLDSVMPDEIEYPQEELEPGSFARVGNNIEEIGGRDGERGGGRDRDRGERGDRPRRRRGGRGRDRNRGGDRPDRGPRPEGHGQVNGGADNGNAIAASAERAPGNNDGQPGLDGQGGKRFRYRDGQQQGQHRDRDRGPRPPREGQGERQFSPRPERSEHQSQHQRREPEMANAASGGAAPLQQGDDGRQSIIKGLWRKITE